MREARDAVRLSLAHSWRCIREGVGPGERRRERLKGVRETGRDRERGTGRGRGRRRRTGRNGMARVFRRTATGGAPAGLLLGDRLGALVRRQRRLSCLRVSWPASKSRAHAPSRVAWRRARTRAALTFSRDRGSPSISPHLSAPLDHNWQAGARVLFHSASVFPPTAANCGRRSNQNITYILRVTSIDSRPGGVWARSCRGAASATGQRRLETRERAMRGLRWNKEALALALLGDNELALIAASLRLALALHFPARRCAFRFLSGTLASAPHTRVYLSRSRSVGRWRGLALAGRRPKPRTAFGSRTRLHHCAGQKYTGPRDATSRGSLSQARSSSARAPASVGALVSRSAGACTRTYAPRRGAEEGRQRR